MARYMLTGIQEFQWKRFKAACAIQGITVKQSFFNHINHVIKDFQSHPEYTQGRPNKPKKGGRNK